MKNLIFLLTDIDFTFIFYFFFDMKVTQEYIYFQLLEIFLVTLKIFISNFIEYDQNCGL